MPELDDHQLLAEFVRDGSETAFATLVQRHVNLVFSTALRSIGNAHAAEEITQAVFIILAQKAKGFSRKIILSGWLYQTARLTAANFLRGEIRRQQREQEAYMQSTLNEPAADVWPQIAPLLDEALEKLGAADRNAIVLRFFENKNLREVGMALGASEDAAKMRVNRALEKLRKIFSKRGVTLTTAVIAGAVAANSLQAAPTGLAKTISAVAMAKGAAAGSSTLALVKGALKVMAWTKAKMAMVTSAVIILATTGTLIEINHVRHAPPAQTGKMKLPTGNVVPMIAYGYSHDVIILASDGSLWSWGEESSGWPVLGLANTNIQNTVSLRRIGYDKDWVSITASDSDCLAVKSDGTLWAWGGNYSHQLGGGTKISRPTPLPSVP
jgi:RNA polymerase sigma factor (sigma-70 family)